MQIKTDFADIPVAGKSMRAFIAHPAAEGTYPGILLFSDIFQLSGPLQRAASRLAGYGFFVLAHEFFHRLEPAGTVFEQTDEGRARAMKNQHSMPIAHFDEDMRAALDHLKARPGVLPKAIGAAGFCIGGHLAYRAALQPDVKGTVCFYPTWLHNGKMGLGENAQSLERAGDILGEMLLLFGTLDPLIPEEGRNTILAALQTAGTRFESRLYPADHGFVRDDRAAYDSECADQAFAEAIAFYRRIFA